MTKILLRQIPFFRSQECILNLSTTMVGRSLPAFKMGSLSSAFKKEKKFGNGDSLVVDLEISKKYDEGYDTYIIDKYTVLNVRDIHRRGDNRGDQGDLFQE